MLRRLPSTVVLGALACAGGAPAPSQSVDARPVLPPGPDARVCREAKPLPLAHRAANVLVLFDRSGSMGAAFGKGTRYSVAAQALEEAVRAYDDKIRFGFQAFPARACAAGASPGCCVEPPSVEVASGAAEAVVRALAAAAPVDGNTPTAGALAQARAYLAGLDDGVANRWILLATDGRPSCSAGGRLGAHDELDAAGRRVAGPCHDALAEVDALVAAGVRVVVLGLGDGVDDEPGPGGGCLDELARHGGAPRPGGRPAFFPATDLGDLERALEQIFGGVERPPCAVELTEPPADPSLVQVFLDGRQIPRGRADGWDFDPPSQARTIRLFGASCRSVSRFQVAEIEVRHGCAPCFGPDRCED